MEMMKYILAAVGLAVVIGVATLLLKKKLPLRWGLSLMACGLILSVVGVGWMRMERRQSTENYGYIYMALRYLEEGGTEEAALYLKRTSLQDDYHLLTAQVLLEQMRGNATMVQVRLYILQEMDRLSEEEVDGIDALRIWTPEKESKATSLLKEQLPLPQKELDALDMRFDRERGVLTEKEEEGTSAETENLRWQIDQAIGRQEVEEALDKAIRLVNLSTSVSDRLLLASVVAEVTYFNNEITTAQFATYASEGKTQKDTGVKEAEELTSEYERLQRKLEVLQLDLRRADDAEAARLASQEQELSEQAETAQLRAENVFAYRALNSIADIHTLKAQVVRAKLYFAIRNYQQAIDALCDTADSAQAMFSTDKNLTSALKMIQKAYASENMVGTDSEEFHSDLMALMGSVHPELLHFSTSSLSRAFTEHIADDQKRYSDGLYVIELDKSAYPTIRVRLGGQKAVIDSIANKSGITMSDTRAAITSYQVEKQSGSQLKNSICFVVDTSGSMDGQPIEDAKDALNQFLNSVETGTEMTLVQFGSSAQTMVELTMDAGLMQDGVDTMGSMGGTDISTGIREGTRALEAAYGARTMILMTDGQSEIDMRAVQEAIDKKITVFAIGFGDINDELLEQIAQSCGGQYLRAENSAELASVYNSLQSVIGNTVTLTYTAGAPEEAERYFYLQEGSSGLSVRKEYDVNALAPVSTVQPDKKPVLQTRETLDQLLQGQQATFRTTLSGSGLDQVRAAKVGGALCPLSSQSNANLSVDVPTTIGDGVHELELTTDTGETIVLQNWLWVGKRVDWRSYRAGTLEIQASQALTLPDARLVLGQSVALSDSAAGDATLVETLSVNLDGVLVFPANVLPGSADAVEPIVLGDAGSAAIYGVLRVNPGDKAYDSRVDQTIFSGAMTLQYSQTKNTITPEEEIT